MGIYLCKTVTAKLRKKEGTSIKTAVLNCLMMYVLIVLPSLLIADILESKVTPLVMAAAGM